MHFRFRHLLLLTDCDSHPQCVHYMGLKEALLDPNMRDPEFCEALSKGRTPHDPFTWWGAEERERYETLMPLQEGTGNEALPHRYLTVTMGGDFGQMSDSKVHSVSSASGGWF
jgi:hypothetical protein